MIAAAIAFFVGAADISYAEYQENRSQPDVSQTAVSELIVKFKPGVVKRNEDGTVEFLTEEVKDYQRLTQPT